MPKAVRVAQAGLQGWRAKVANNVAAPVSKHTPLNLDQIRAGIGALFFALAVVYVIRSAKAAARELKR